MSQNLSSNTGGEYYQQGGAGRYSNETTSGHAPEPSPGVAETTGLHQGTHGEQDGYSEPQYVAPQARGNTYPAPDSAYMAPNNNNYLGQGYHHGGYPPANGYGYAPPPRSTEIPIWVTVLTTLVFGLFGLIPAWMGEEAFKRNGNVPRKNSHWKAFAFTMFAEMLLFFAVLLLAVLMGSATGSTIYY